MLEIKLNCCEGDPNGHCYQRLCPHYRRAEDSTNARIPYVGTGFGNLYGSPSKSDILREVRAKIKENAG